MPSTTRRAVLGAVGAAALAGTAGCSVLGSDRPPAGSLRFENTDDLPHAISLRVTGVGEAPGDEPGTVAGDATAPPAQRNLTASVTLSPGERQTFRSVFTEPVWYGVRFELDGTEPANGTGATAFHPAPPDRESGRFLVGRVQNSTSFSWGISSTDVGGDFDLG